MLFQTETLKLNKKQTGTIWPLIIQFLISDEWPKIFVWTSDLSISPAEICRASNFDEITDACVPFPDPGPPSNLKTIKKQTNPIKLRFSAFQQ